MAFVTSARDTALFAQTCPRSCQITASIGRGCDGRRKGGNFSSAIWQPSRFSSSASFARATAAGDDGGGPSRGLRR
ncbi:hypothetical protein PUN28_015845 [Cardiocondyla obscurior]|uniref:Uncharacterized protein n=1 Tax=Cardiocondyla obscurior TaxID=286306 RepID=A0AAW2ETB7_9HYME